MILQESNGTLKTVARREFPTEKQLQTLIENNLEEIFGCKLIATEFSTGNVHSGRIDTLAISENGNPVIIEYKKVENSNLVTQGLFYLDWIKDHKGDFQVAAEQKLGNIEINWSNIRVICIAPSFDKYSLHAVNHLGAGLELWQYHLYENGVLEIDEIFGASQAQKNLKNGGKSSSPKSIDNAEYSVQTHRLRGSETVREVFDAIDEQLLSLNPSISAVPQKHYIAYKFAKNIACIEVQAKKLKLWIHLPFDDTMPSFVKDVAGIGHYGTGNLEISLTEPAQVDQAMELIKRAYLRAGGD